MKYLVLIFSSADAPWTGSAEDMQSLRELYAIRDELTATGELVSSEGLAEPADGRIVRVRDGARVVTDGPFGEAKEQVAGFFMIDCAGDDRADEIAGLVAAAVRDRVEVRGVTLSV